MPKKKHSFIDKNASQTFAVVHRSRRDPLAQDARAPQHVLTPTVTGNQVKRERKERWSAATAPANLGHDPDQDLRDSSDVWYNPRAEELATYQIRDDGYDYLQHMKEIGSGDFIGFASVAEEREAAAAAEAKLKEAQRRKATGAVMLREEAQEKTAAVLPAEALPSELYHPHYTEVGEGEDWVDPEVWEAMQAAEEETEGWELWDALEDNAVDMMQQGSKGGIFAAEGEERAQQGAQTQRHQQSGRDAAGGAASAGEQESQEEKEEEELDEEAILAELQRDNAMHEAAGPSAEDLKVLEILRQAADEEPSEEEMIDAIFGWADEDEDGLLNLEEFVRLQLECGNETPSQEQWETMVGALRCDPARGISKQALTLLYEGEGPWDDFGKIFGVEQKQEEMPPELAAFLARKDAAVGGGHRGSGTRLDGQSETLAGPSAEDLRLLEILRHAAEEEPSEEEMIDAIFGWADEDEDGLLNLEEFVRLQLECGNETPSQEQWETMVGALRCDPARGISKRALTVLYEGEGPWDDFGKIFGVEQKEEEMPPELAAFLARKDAERGSHRGSGTLLDEQFETLAAEYDDADIGGLSEHDKQGQGTLDLSQVGDVLDEFVEEQEANRVDPSMMIGQNVEEVKVHVLKRVEQMAAADEAKPDGADDADMYHCPEYAEESDDGEEDDLKRGFDVQSIVTTYSNLENHPGKIAVPKRTPKKKQPQPQPQPPPPPQHDPLTLRAGDIQLTKKGMPVVVHEGYEEEESDEEEEAFAIKGEKRPKGETAEEKRARKAAVKAERAMARQRKKQLKRAFKKEEHGQSQRLTSAYGAHKGRTVLKLG